MLDFRDELPHHAPLVRCRNRVGVALAGRKMKIVLVGPGAIGCLFAGILAEAGHEVWLLDKRRERAALVTRDGVRIESDAGLRVIRVRATVDPAEIGLAELVCLCVKTYDTAAALHHALPLVGPGTIAMSLQNGYGGPRCIAAEVPAERVLGGITSHGSTSLGAGHVRHAGSGPTWIAPCIPAATGLADRVAAVFSGAGLVAEVVADIEGMTWSKLVINAAINPLTAIHDVRNSALLDDPGLRQTMIDAAREAAEVARARGVRLMFPDAGVETERVCLATGNNVSSMLQDVRAGRRTEIEAITGVIVGEARALGLRMPVNEMLLAGVLGLETERQE